MKKEKGITLVSLVVTIIILIILAGVSINAVIGENGIITIAKKAKENVELAQIEEEKELNELYTQIEYQEEITQGTESYNVVLRLNEFKKKIADYIYEATNEQIDLTNKNVEPNYQTASVETFGKAIKQIVAKVTKIDENKAATASDIVQGKEAWVNGKKVEGTGTISLKFNLKASRETSGWDGSFALLDIDKCNYTQIHIDKINSIGTCNRAYVRLYDSSNTQILISTIYFQDEAGAGESTLNYNLDLTQYPNAAKMQFILNAGRSGGVIEIIDAYVM